MAQVYLMKWPVSANVRDVKTEELNLWIYSNPLVNAHLILPRTEFSSVHILQGVLAQLSNRAMSFSPVC